MKHDSTAATVIKFGGSSLASANAFAHVVSRINEQGKRLVVVVSACADTTDKLLEATQSAVEDDLPNAFLKIDEVRRLYQGILSESGIEDKWLVDEIENTFQKIKSICASLQVLRELSPRVEAQVSTEGERLSAHLLVAALTKQSRQAQFVDATDVISIKRVDGLLVCDVDLTKDGVSKNIDPHLKQERIVVVPGFYARDQKGDKITLGRGGTDYSAALLAQATSASKLVLYKEVDGFMTADPRSVSNARVVPQLHYREAAELAYYGASILHPRAMIPLIDSKISLYVRNTFKPSSDVCTVINADNPDRGYPVKAITAVRHQALVSIEGKGMLGVPGIASRTFGALAAADLSVSVISQASSESSICFVVPSEEAEHAKELLVAAFRHELDQQLINRIAVTNNLATVAVVGLGMSGCHGVAARVFRAIANSHVNIVAIAQGSSEHNISLVIKDHSVPLALSAIHDEFQLHKAGAIPDQHSGQTPLAIFGFGQIGQHLTDLLGMQEGFFADRYGIDLRCIALADSRSLGLDPHSYSKERLREQVENKANNLPLGDSSLKELWQQPLDHPIFIDTTASDSNPVLMDALDNGFHVVLANKKPLTGPLAEYNELFKAANAKRLQIRYEATVGAGLPVLDTIDKLKASGDEILEISGCLSGTLSYLMSSLESGLSYSAAVADAAAAGYTEPHPRDDLDGRDVARKALILARCLGYELDMSDIAIEALFRPELDNEDPKAFVQNLAKMDEEFKERFEQCEAKDEVLRYVARIDSESIKVGIEQVPRLSVFGQLSGTDNQIVIRTKRYDQNPLSIKGPGAGAAVTAQGVLNDIVSIANGRS